MNPCTSPEECLIVYGKPGCAVCGVAVRKLKADGVCFEYRDVTADPAAEARVRELGYQTLPVFEADGKHFPFGPDFRHAVATRVSHALDSQAA